MNNRKSIATSLLYMNRYREVARLTSAIRSPSPLKHLTREVYDNSATGDGGGLRIGKSISAEFVGESLLMSKG